MFIQIDDQSYVDLARMVYCQYRQRVVYPVPPDPPDGPREPEEAHMVLTFCGGHSAKLHDPAVMAIVQDYVDDNLHKPKKP